MLHIKLNGITKFSNMVVSILPADSLPPTTLGGWGQEVKKSKFFFFSEHGHVTYQIKGINEFSIMVTKILPVYPHASTRPDPGNSQLFQLNIKLKGITKFNNMVANILPADTPPPTTTGGWVSKDQNSTFSEHDHVAYQIKGNHQFNNMVANILPTYPHAPTPTLGIGQ